MNIRELLIHRYSNAALCTLLANKNVRRILFKRVESHLRHESMTYKPDQCPLQAKQDRMDVIIGLLNGFDRTITKGIISRPVMKHMLDALLGNVMLNEDAKRIQRKQGTAPPSFVVISPTGKCNLRCEGCYAADAALHGKELSMQVFDRILCEKRELWGSHWTVISGGEPFLWYDNDWDLVRLARRHPHDVFMVYTHGIISPSQLMWK